ncbi:hypothetical protein [Microbacterium halophytorum]|uniref:hypothetical protein n=1 Tax=Microbacterium halophytorum TaxID=2067568 RepID=UPI000CFB12A8|nr:hypothetical protein [Microbacterium halophytorum]
MPNDLMSMDPSWSTWAERLRWHLGEIPTLMGAILALRVPLRAARYDREVVSGSGADGSPAPLNVEAIDDADDLWRELARFGATVEGWFEELGEWDEHAGVIAVSAMPGMTSIFRGHLVAGVHVSLDEATAYDEASDVTQWIGRRADLISGRDDLRVEAERLCVLVRKLRSRYLVDRVQRSRPLRRQCRTCGEVAVVVEWAELVSRTKAHGVGRCTACGQGYVELSKAA